MCNLQPPGRENDVL